MAIHCVSCNKDFGSQGAFDQHVRSLAHASRRLANQLDVDRKLASQTSKSNRKTISTKSQPGSQNIFVSKVYPLGSQQHCIPCNRFFKDKSALNQHLQSSKIHKAAIPLPEQVQTISRKSSTLGPHQLNPSLEDAIASSSSPSQALNYDGGNHFKQQISWSVISGSEYMASLAELSRHCHSPEDLLRNKYLLSPYSDAYIAGLRKCRKCDRLAKNSQNSICYFHPGKPTTTVGQRHFTCCRTANRGCTSAPTHKYRKARHADKFQSFANSPPASPRKPTFRAIALDCEMAEVKGLRSEVILICAIDYFTGAVLLNRLVHPGERVRDWRSEIHGITEAAMKNAVSQGHALAGWAEARAELWKFIDQETILVGHALQHDLNVLRMVHTRVVDSAVLARNAVGMYNYQWGLQKLCKDLLSLEIRNNKRGIHDCLEDVLAAREIVLRCTQNKQELATWAEVKKMELIHKEEQRKAARQKASERAEAEKLMVGLSSDFESDFDEYGPDEEEILSWSDIAEDFGWPHPDTGYDPWSD